MAGPSRARPFFRPRPPRAPGGWPNLAGAVLALANRPFTLKFIMPVNRELLAAAPRRETARILLYGAGEYGR